MLYAVRSNNPGYHACPVHKWQNCRRICRGPRQLLFNSQRSILRVQKISYQLPEPTSATFFGWAIVNPRVQNNNLLLNTPVKQIRPQVIPPFYAGLESRDRPVIWAGRANVQSVVHAKVEFDSWRWESWPFNHKACMSKTRGTLTLWEGREGLDETYKGIVAFPLFSFSYTKGSIISWSLAQYEGNNVAILNYTTQKITTYFPTYEFTLIWQ